MDYLNEDKLSKISHEHEMINRMNKSMFFKFMEESGFELEMFLYVKKIPSCLIIKFNELLREAKNRLKIKMYEMILLIEKEYTSVAFLMMIVDEANKEIIREEMGDDYNVSYINNNLSELFE